MVDSQENFSPSITDRIEVRRRLRRQIEEAKPRAEVVLNKSGIKPTVDAESQKKYNRAKINIAGELVREKYKSETDGLTGIPNRDGFIRRGKEELERAKRLGYKVAVVVLDLNNLKITNDSKGHDVGDNLLKDTAECLVKGTRTTDVVSRWGGDEFGAVLANTDYDGIKIWWDRQNKLFADRGLSIGGGVVIIDPNDLDRNEDWEQQFIKYRDLADKPLTDAKNQTKQQGINTLLNYGEWVNSQSSP